MLNPDQLTLLAFATSAIHDHRTWAVIGVSSGQEVDELLIEDGPSLRRTSRHDIGPGETLVLDPQCIHFIANPGAQPARGTHVYGKNLAHTDRRMWDPVTCTPRPMDFALFEEWEKSLTSRSAAAGATVPPLIS